MAAKRSRLGRTSSSGDTTVLSAPVYESSEVRWPVIRPPPVVAASIPPSPEKNPPSIFDISSPVYDHGDSTRVERVEFGAFLEMCCYCRKRIGNDEEVFMCSMRAFCTAECRQKQLDIEKNLEKHSPRPKFRSGKRAGI